VDTQDSELNAAAATPEHQSLLSTGSSGERLLAKTTWRCSFCPQGFVKKTTRDRHEKLHDEHLCPVCGKKLSNNSNLEAHVKSVNYASPDFPQD
jgi:hypothetical protein